MLDQHYRNIADCLHDNKNYKQLSGYFKELIQQRNIPATVSTVTTMQKLLAAEEAQPLSKLLAIRFLKENLESGSYCFIKLVETQLLPIMARIALHQKDSKASDRGKSMFKNRSDYINPQRQTELEQLGLSLHIIVLQTLEILGKLVSLSPYQYHEFPSMFASMYLTLKNNGVSFPAQYSYYKPADQEKITKVFRECDSSEHRTKEICTFLPFVFEQARKELDDTTNGDYLALLGRIAASGDSNCIQDYVQLLEVTLAQSKSNSQSMMVLRLLNELFTAAEVEIMIKLRDTFLLQLVGNIFLIDFEQEKLSHPLFETSQSKTIRRMCYEMLRLWQALLTRHHSISKDIVDGFCLGLPLPHSYKLLNFQDCEIEFCQNFESHRLLNDSKNSFDDTMPQTKAKLKKALEYYRQLRIDGKKIVEELLSEQQVQSPAPPIPQANIFVSRHEFFQSPATSKPVSSENGGISAERGIVSVERSIAQMGETSEARVYFDASICRNDLVEQISPSLSGSNVKSMQRVEVPCVSVEINSANNPNFMKKRQMNTREPLPPPPIKHYTAEEQIQIARKATPMIEVPNLEDESVIVEPLMDPLDTSYHETNELTANIISKLKMQPIPTFKTATAVDHFILPSKNYNEPELRLNKTKVSEDMNILRSLNPTQRKNATERHQQSENQLKTALDLEMDKMTRMYIERIQELERSLQESQLKERKYMKVIEEQRSEITSLRSEVSISNRSRVSDPATYLNEIEYLSNENKTLRNRLDRLSSTGELAKSSRPSAFEGSVSINRSLNRAQQPLEHPTVMLTKEYDLKIRKPLLRNKELLHKNETVEVGVISCRDNGLRLTLFYTFSHKVQEMNTQLEILEPLEANFANLQIKQCSPNRQEKQTISFKVPLEFKLQQPRLTATIKLATGETQTLELVLPVNISKFMELSTQTVSNFKTKFREQKAQRYCTEQIIYSKRILKEHRSMQQYFQKAVHLNPHRQPEYNDGIKPMKYGWEAVFVSTGIQWKFLIKIRMSRGGTLFIEGIDEANSSTSADLLRCYLADLMAMFVKETNR